LVIESATKTSLKPSLGFYLSVKCVHKSREKHKTFFLGALFDDVKTLRGSTPADSLVYKRTEHICSQVGGENGIEGPRPPSTDVIHAGETIR